MKKQLIGYLTCFTFLLTSCSDKKDAPEPEPPVDKPEYVMIAAQSPSIETKTELMEDRVSVKWTKGDKIAVFMTSAVDNKLHLSEYIIEENTIDTDIPLFNGNLLWQKENENHMFYSCYPYIGCEDVKELPITLPSAQIQKGSTNTHLAGLDILVAKGVTQKAPTTFTGSYTKVPMFFQHIFAIIEIRFYAKSPDSYIDKVTVSASDTYLSLTEGTIDMTLSESDQTSGRINNPKGENSITMTLTDAEMVPVVAGGELSADNTIPVYFMVCPGDHTNGEVNFDIETSDGKKYAFTRPGRIIHPADKLIVYLELTDNF